MIKRTLYFSNPCYLKKKSNQLLVEYPDDEPSRSVPIEDIGMVVPDNMQITLSNALIMALTDKSAAIVTTNFQHLPEGLLLPMNDHHTFTENVKSQINATEPLKKNLWQQTVTAKISNQATLLEYLGLETDNMQYWARKVKSGDPENYEARAAAFYWANIFTNYGAFKRFRFGAPPNNLLNYGYAILRGVIARSLVGSGMMTFSGIHHRNKYNPYCLADDIMEPYRPYVDKVVLEIVSETKKMEELDELTPDIKKKLLVVPAVDVTIDDQNSPLMVAAQRTTASLMQCFEGSIRKILYPIL